VRRGTRLGRALGLVVGYALLAVWCLRPVSLAPGALLPGPEHEDRFGLATLADVYLNIWVLAAGARSLATDPARFFHPPAFYPEPYALAFSEHLLGQQPLFAPAYLATGNPVLGLNLSLLASSALLGLGVHCLVRHLGGSGPAAVLAAVLAVAAPWRVGPAAIRVQTLMVHWIPFLLLFLDRWLVRGRWTDLALAAACLGLQVITSYYAGYAALVAAGLYLVIVGRTVPRRALAAIAGLAVGLLLVVPVSLPYTYVAGRGGLGELPPELLMRLLAGTGAPGVLTGQTVGFLPVVLSGLLLFARRAPGSQRSALLVIALAGYVLALGPVLYLPREPARALAAAGDILIATDGPRLADRVARPAAEAVRLPTPYAALAAMVPGFERLRAPYRFGVLPAIVLPVTAGLGVTAVAARLAAAGGPLTVALALLVLVRVPPVRATPVEVGAALPPAYAWLAAHGEGRPLAEVPFGRTADMYEEARAMYFAIYHRLPLLNGYSGHVPARMQERAAVVARLPDPEALGVLCRETGLGWILVHRERLMPPLRARWEQPGPAFREAATFGPAVVFAVDCAAVGAGGGP
jgi:hypothetical protein